MDHLAPHGMFPLAACWRRFLSFPSAYVQTRSKPGHRSIPLQCARTGHNRRRRETGTRPPATGHTQDHTGRQDKQMQPRELRWTKRNKQNARARRVNHLDFCGVAIRTLPTPPTAPPRHIASSSKAKCCLRTFISTSATLLCHSRIIRPDLKSPHAHEAWTKTSLRASTSPRLATCIRAPAWNLYPSGVTRIAWNPSPAPPPPFPSSSRKTKLQNGDSPTSLFPCRDPASPARDRS